MNHLFCTKVQCLLHCSTTPLGRAQPVGKLEPLSILLGTTIRDEKATLRANDNEFSWICWLVNLIMTDNNEHITTEIIEKTAVPEQSAVITAMTPQQQPQPRQAEPSAEGGRKELHSHTALKGSP